jgi:hypothetical protein
VNMKATTKPRASANGMVRLPRPSSFDSTSPLLEVF